MKQDIEFIVQSVKDGNGDPIEAAVLLRSIIDMAEKAYEELKPVVITEVEKHGKSVDKYGAHIEVRNGASRWNFKGISAIESAQKKLKYLEDLAKIGGGVDAETGEEVQAATKIEGATTIAIKLLKAA